MKRQIFVLLGIVCSSLTFAQNEVDALRYSFLNYNGTSRFAGSGGSMSAIGADLGAVNINPAGQGKYNRGEFTFTTNISSTTIGSNYNGVDAIDYRTNANIPNIGIVLSGPVRDGSQWRTFQFGFNHTRTNDFQSNELIKGTHSNSLLDVFVGKANGISPGNLLDNAGFDAGLAYDTYIIEYDSAAGEYYPWYQTNQVEQNQVLNRRGAQYATDFTISGNYADKVLVGGTLGFPSIRYREDNIYSEKFIGDTIYDLDSYTYAYKLNTRSTGFNAKIGVIVMPHPSVRIGFAAHSPTWYSMSDAYSASISSTFNDGSTYESISPNGTYDYRLRTPGRLIGSAGFLLGNRGFISAEYEYVDYKTAKLGARDYSFNTENAAISTNYASAENLKLGAEFRVTNYFTVRGGVSKYGSPIKNSLTNLEQSRFNYSGGLGYRDRNFSLDFTYLLSKWNNEFYLYDASLTSASVRKYELHNFMVTAGFRF